MSAAMADENTPRFVRDVHKFSEVEQQVANIGSSEKPNVMEIRDALVPIIKEESTPEEIRELAKYLANNMQRARDLSRESKKSFIAGYYERVDKVVDYLREALEEEFWTIKDENPEIDTKSLMVIYDTVNRALKHYDMALREWKKAERDRERYLEEIDRAGNVLENCGLKLVLLDEEDKLSEEAINDLKTSLQSLQSKSALSPESQDYQKLDYSII